MDSTFRDALENASKNLVGGVMGGVAASRYIEQGALYLPVFGLIAFVIIVGFFYVVSVAPDWIDSILNERYAENEDLAPTKRLNRPRSSSPSLQYQRQSQNDD